MISECESAITFEQVTVSSRGMTILDRVDAAVPKGCWTAVVGPNGAGKTTLLQTLLGVVPYRGEIRYGSSRHRPRLGYVPQRFAFDRGMPLTVMEFMLMGRQRLPFWFGCGKGKERALELLAAVKADSLAPRRLGALSGGELQRVLLALALQEEPDLLILDEPTAGVDFQGELVFCELLEDLRRSLGFTQIMVSHDLATVTHHADHVICINHGVVAQGPPGLVLTREVLTAMFGLHMGLVDARAMPAGDGSCTAPCCREEAADE
ncbi:MAG: metal ABC transporter ATP-binding protein [Proteobacteria bacterium]|nr:metal ABC transporter ATP-binding protein [Pseudomonadota bacterium]MBU1685896.1 metal ABC transporter ATP-binding protein [Pseudomonadota bacterium]